jgi:hypothetical protein
MLVTWAAIDLEQNPRQAREIREPVLSSPANDYRFTDQFQILSCAEIPEPLPARAGGAHLFRCEPTRAPVVRLVA